ncbi:MAG: hypothetical protein AAGH64_12490 [Planctomycetota bacterium]
MHIITKFLVILTSVLAVLLAGLTIAYSANADRVVQDMQQARNEVTAARAAASAAEARIAAGQDAKNQEILELTGTVNTQSGELSDLRSQLASALSEVERLRLSEQQFQNRIDTFIALSDQDQKLREALQGEQRTLRDENNAQARRIIDLVERVSDLVAQTESLENQNRALAEQNTTLRRGPDATRTAGALPETFQARVTGVVEDADGSILVEINAGTSDRLAEGMELIAVRNGSYLGTIELMRVDLNEAVGRVTLQSGNGSIRSNDTIRPGAGA